MSDKWEICKQEIQRIKINFDKSYKCLNRAVIPKEDTQIKHLKILVACHNEIVHLIRPIFNEITTKNRLELINFFKAIKTKLEVIFKRLSVVASVPESFNEIIDIKFRTPVSTNSDSSSGSDTETEDLNSSIVENKSTDNKKDTMTPVEFLNLATKLLPEFNGEVENLQKFLNALDLLNSIKETHEILAVQLIKTKLTQKAQKLITTENSVEEIKNTLKAKVKGETSVSASSKLLCAKQNNKTGDEFIKEIELLANKLETAYISDGMTADLAQTFATQTAVKAITKNARSDKVKTVMLAGQFKNLSEVTTKFVEANTDVEEQRINFIQNRNAQKPWSNRGRGRRNFGYRNQNYNNFAQSRNSNRNNFRQSQNSNRNNNSSRGRHQNVRYVEAMSENDTAPQTAHLGTAQDYQN